jgi:hypothetical protein
MSFRLVKSIRGGGRLYELDLAEGKVVAFWCNDGPPYLWIGAKDGPCFTYSKSNRHTLRAFARKLLEACGPVRRSRKRNNRENK